MVNLCGGLSPKSLRMGNTSNFLTRTQRRKFFFLLLGASISFYLLTLLHTTYHPFKPHSEPQTEAPSDISNTPSNKSPPSTPNSSPIATPPKHTRPKSPYCVAAFLGADYHGEDGDNDDADWYYVGARTLVYQLLHSPTTRFTDPIKTEPIPVIVLVTKDVRESKRKRLEADGATVIEIEEIAAEFAIGEPRYAQVLTKLRALDPELMPYEKVFLMDTDMVLTRPIDEIFQDESTQLRPVDRNRTGPDAELAPLPETFMFAATPESHDRDHPYPFLDLDRKEHYFNVGCMLFSPSKEIYNFYLAILAHPDLFGHGWPEQDLLNYIHRLEGPMPWSRLHFSWYLNWPNINDLDGQMAIIHTKYWSEEALDLPERFALSRVGEMQGYWIGKESA